MLRTLGEQPTLWESMLHSGMLTMSPDHERIDELLDDERCSEPYRTFFDASLGRPSIPIETYLWSMFLRYRNPLGFETRCKEGTDPSSWQRFAGSSRWYGAAPEDAHEGHHAT